MRVGPVNYKTKNETPSNYVCDDCGIKGCKLWREYQTFANNTKLLCCDCAGKDQEKDVSKITDVGKIELKYEDCNFTDFTDQIGWMVPAVPVEEGGTFWDYTSVPQDGVDWWRKLPNRVITSNCGCCENDKPCLEGPTGMRVCGCCSGSGKELSFEGGVDNIDDCQAGGLGMSPDEVAERYPKAKSIKDRYDIVNKYLVEWRIIANFIGFRAASVIVEALDKLEKGTDIEGADVGAIKRLAYLLNERGL